MSIRFKCANCQKPLSVKDELAGKRAACPACKKPILIPAPTAAPADVEDFAASALADPVEEAPKPVATAIDYTCTWCDETVQFAAELAGKQAPCPSCKRIIKVPLPKVEKKKDWREINRNGPAAARMNLPEQLEGAWGTEAKSRVSRDTLQEAGAIEEAPARPVGVGGWIRRGTAAVVAVAVIAGLVVAISRNRTRTVQKNVIEEAELVAKEREKESDPKKKLHAVLWAEIERAAGELQLAQNKAELARQKFMAARIVAGRSPKESNVDHDFFLMGLALTQMEMAGTDDQVRTKARMDWEESKSSYSVFKEVIQTVQNIKSVEAKVIAVRELATELVARKQAHLAISLAAGQLDPVQAGPGKISPQAPQLVALAFAHGDFKKFDKLIAAPDPKVPLERATRLAYAEGNARKGELTAAMDFVKKEGPPLDQLEAALGVAGVLLSNRTNKEAESQAAPFVAEAFEIKSKFKKGVAPWLTFQLCRSGARIPAQAATAKELIKELPASFKVRAQLEWLDAKLARGENADVANDLPEADGPSRGLAWITLARRATLLGRAAPLPETESEDGVYRAFANIGTALAGVGPTK